MGYMSDVEGLLGGPPVQIVMPDGWGAFASTGQGGTGSPTRVLHTATLLHREAEGEIAVFHACHAAGRREVLESLAERIPVRHLPSVVVRAGIDPDHPVVVRLVPEPMRRRLAEFGDCSPTSRPLASGLCLHIAEHVAID